MAENDTGMGGFAAPGERRIRIEGKASEITVPWGQYVRLMIALGILFATVSFAAWVIGPGTLWGLGMLPMLALIVLSQRVGEKLDGTRIIATMTALTVALFWMLNGYALCSIVWPFPLVAWLAMVKVWIIVGVVLVVCAPTAWIAYRFAAEIADPSGPTAPRAAVTRAGTQWPWTGEVERSDALDLDEMRRMMKQMLSQQSHETLRVEVVEGATATGGVRVGGGISADALPVSRETMRQLVSAIDVGHYKWSRRDVASMEGIGDDRARELMRVLVEDAGFLHYPQGPNHPGGAVPTRKGQVFMQGLLM